MSIPKSGPGQRGFKGAAEELFNSAGTVLTFPSGAVAAVALPAQPTPAVAQTLPEAALGYARMGWPVFPCNPLAKTPATPNGFKDATIDEDQIKAWWTENPDYNIAIALQTTGLCVVDLDCDAGIAEFADLENDEFVAAAPTLTVRTPRGGQHLWFRGSLPASQHRLAPHIDTRGRGSYVLLPPSRTADGAYEVVDDRPIAELPEWIAQRAQPRHEVRETAAVVEPDQPCNIERARDYLRDLVKRGDVAIQRSGGDARTVKVADDCGDLGISEATALELILEEWNPHCRPPWDAKELAAKVGNAYRYRQNVLGVWAAEPASETHKHLTRPEAQRAKSLSRFRGREPDEDEQLPPMEFWDAHGMLPKVPGGGVMIFYGRSGDYKSSVVLSLIVDAILHRGARVLYLAGEGGHGLGKQRLPAECHARGITTKELRGKYRKVDAVPLLASRDEWEETLSEQADLRPDIVVVDTLGTGIPGLDQNAASTGSLLTGNAPIRLACEKWGALVIVIAHAGKDLSRGIAGTYAFKANTDAVIEIEAAKPAGGQHFVTARVAKMRDARDGQSIRFQVVNGQGGVPLPRVMSDREFLCAKAKAGPSDDVDEARIVRALKELGADLRTGDARTVTKAVLVSQLMLAVPQPAPDDDLGLIQQSQIRAAILDKLHEETRAPSGNRKAGKLRQFTIGQAEEHGARERRWAIPISYRGDCDGGAE